MPRVCTLCRHADRDGIDSALLRGEAYRNIAERYGTSPASLLRHKAHLSERMVKAEEAREVTRADSLLDQVKALHSKALSILAKAEEGGDLRTALAAIRETRGNLELLARLLGELQEKPVALIVLPEWITMRTALLSALDPFPDARAAAARALGGGHAGA
jgi:hypothetical protein